MSLYQYVSVYRLKVLLRCCQNSTADDFLCYLPSSLCFLCKPGSRRNDFLKPVKSFTDGRGGEGSIQTSGKINLMCVLHQTSVAFFIHIFLSAPFFPVQDKYHCPIFFFKWIWIIKSWEVGNFLPLNCSESYFVDTWTLITGRQWRGRHIFYNLLCRYHQLLKQVAKVSNACGQLFSAAKINMTSFLIVLRFFCNL